MMIIAFLKLKDGLLIIFQIPLSSLQIIMFKLLDMVYCLASVIPYYIILCFGIAPFPINVFRSYQFKFHQPKQLCFLQFLNRKLIAHGTRINCTLFPECIFFEDISGQVWHLTQNGTVSKFKLQLLFASLNELNFWLPKFSDFNSHLVRPHFHKLAQPTVLDLISANHQSLQEISQITDVGQGGFLQGLGSLFGITIQSLAQGGKTIIKDVENGVKHGFEGLGTFSHDLTTGIGNATGTIIQSTGHAFKDVASGTGTFFQNFLGGISGTILWTVILLIIIYLLYLKFAHQCFNRSDETVGPVQDRQQSSLDVSVPSSSDFTDQDILSYLYKIFIKLLVFLLKVHQNHNKYQSVPRKGRTKQPLQQFDSISRLSIVCIFTGVFITIIISFRP